MRKQLIALAAVLLLPVSTVMASGGVHLESANIDLNNHTSLQNGAKYYMNYCQGCHSLSAARYNRMATDIGLPVLPENTGKSGEEADKVADANAKLLADNLMFTRDEDGKPLNLGSLMHSSIPAKDAAKWFGSPVPDLSLVGRSRGADWIYTYLKSFYLDDKRPTGVNNTAFPNVGMPHVLWELQGWQELEVHESSNGHKTETLKLAKPGSMSASEYDTVVRDLTNFLAYTSEPAQLHRKKYGIFAMLLLIVFIGFAYLLKKEFWKDVR
jgi:ubiquinol-cytochrome c reductase cytochrome c1 subunit